MSKLGLLFSFAANFAPRFFQVRRSTWIAVGVGLLVLFGLLIWAAVALIGWFFGQSKSLLGTAPGTTQGALGQVEQALPGVREKLGVMMGAAPEAAQRALGQVEQVLPGTGEKLGAIVPALKPETQPQRDVSGTDLGPVARYPGLTRTHWHRETGRAAVEYGGKADYAAVLDHYAKSFAAQGFAQSVQSATPESETHEYTQDRERITLKIVQKPRGGVSVRIETALR